MTDTRTPYTTTAEPNALLERLSEQERELRIECLEALRHAALMQVGAYERELASLGRTYKKKERV
jgi:hypothetical protein